MSRAEKGVKLAPLMSGSPHNTMTISILVGAAACIAGIALVREALRRRDPEGAANIGSVSQNWVAEHRVGRSEDGLR
jgi:hypothetical protein